MEILLRVLAGPPLWVWPLLAGLIVLGVMSSRDRVSAIWPMALLPLLGLTGLPSLMKMPDPVTAWTSFGAAYALGALVGAWKQRRTLLWVRDGRAAMRGEWFSLAFMMLIFWTNFAERLLTAIAPVVLTNLPAKALLPAIKGLGAGFFLGRVIAVMRAPRQAGA